MNKHNLSKATRPEKEAAIAEILKENPKATRAASMRRRATSGIATAPGKKSRTMCASR